MNVQQAEELLEQALQPAVKALEWPGILVPIGPPLGLFALVMFTFWLLIRRSQARTQVRAELHRQLLDKFGSGREFAEFLESKGSQRLLEGLWAQQVNAKERVLRTMGAGVVLTVLGLGALALSWRTEGFVYPAVLCLALGGGFLVSTGISYRLSKKWGLLKDKESSAENEPIAHN